MALGIELNIPALKADEESDLSGKALIAQLQLNIPTAEVWGEGEGGGEGGISF